MLRVLLWLALGVYLSAMAGPSPAQVRTGSAIAERLTILTVSGRGEVSSRPDQATVRLGAEAQASDAASAQSQVNAIMERALQQIRAVGISQQAIRTTGLQLFPVYARQRPEPRPDTDEEPRPPAIVAYRASNTVQIEVRSLQLVGKVIDAGVASGANRLEGITFELKNDRASRGEALQLAVQEARAKAEAIARALRMRLVGVSEVSEGGVNIIPPPPMPMMEMSRAAVTATPVEPGELRVEASVTIRYRIAPTKS